VQCDRLELTDLSLPKIGQQFGGVIPESWPTRAEYPKNSFPHTVGTDELLGSRVYKRCGDLGASSRTALAT
jgi:hypothetical protein